MFSWLWNNKNKKELVENHQLRIVINELFPDYKTEILSDNETKISIDASLDENLYSALMELENGDNDIIIRNTIRKAIKKLRYLREVLNIQQEIDPNTRGIIFDIPEKNEEITFNE
jgi:hypothetical protein